MPITLLTPAVRKLKGALKASPIDVQEYRQYLEDKYL